MEIALTLCVVGGILCAVFASSKGRSGLGWFVIGTLFPLIGLILIFVLPPAGERHRATDRLPAPQGYLDPAGVAHVRATTFDAFERLVRLKDRGELSPLELAEKRAELLAQL